MNNRHKFQIMEAALCVHMDIMGSSDGVGSDEAAAFLRERLAEWQPSHSRAAAFDEAVKTVCVVALAEHDAYLLGLKSDAIAR